MAMITIHQWKNVHKGLGELLRVTRGAIVVLTFDRPVLERYWLFEYVPELLSAERSRYIALDDLRQILEPPGRRVHIANKTKLRRVVASRRTSADVASRGCDSAIHFRERRREHEFEAGQCGVRENVSFVEHARRLGIVERVTIRRFGSTTITRSTPLLMETASLCCTRMLRSRGERISTTTSRGSRSNETKATSGTR